MRDVGHQAESNMKHEHAAILELDKLKTVCRNSIIADGSRKENTAEHSWHMAMTLMAIQRYIPDTVDLDHAMRMSLVHDICEIGAGDVSVYSSSRGQETETEASYMSNFRHTFGDLGPEIADLWQEYTDQKTPESRWVKLVDQILPFILNLATEGRIWKERGICRSQVLRLNLPVNETCPVIYDWMKGKINEAVENGWLRDA